MKNTTDIGDQLENLRAKVTRANVLSWIAVVLAFTGGAYANHLLVLSTDIVNGEVKSVDLGTGSVTTLKLANNAVTAAKIAGNAVTSAKIATSAVTSAKIADSAVTLAKLADNAVTGNEVANGTLTSADIDQSTLDAIDASTLNGFTRSEVSGVGEAPALTSVQDLPDCSPGIDYMVRTITVPKAGWVVVNSLFTAETGQFVSGSGIAVAARVEKTAPAFVAGTFGETTITAGFQRANLAMTDRFEVSAGQNTFVLKACDSSDVGLTAHSIRGKMTFIYSPNLLASF